MTTLVSHAGLAFGVLLFMSGAALFVWTARRAFRDPE
jgi:hypothetical protein